MFGFPTAKKGLLDRGVVTFLDGPVNPMLEVESVQVKGGPPATPILMASLVLADQFSGVALID